jgi:hypothetical protein
MEPRMHVEWTTILATLAVVVSIVGLLWNINSSRKAHSIDLRGAVMPNALVMSDHPLANNPLISVSVSNHGTMPCFIEVVHIVVYDSWFATRWGRARAVLGSIEGPSSEITKKPLPYKLEAGARYQGFITQTDQIVSLSNSKYAYVVFLHLLSRKRGYRIRLPAIETDDFRPAPAARNATLR